MMPQEITNSKAGLQNQPADNTPHHAPQMMKIPPDSMRADLRTNLNALDIILIHLAQPVRHVGHTGRHTPTCIQPVFIFRFFVSSQFEAHLP
jgi:hypothetical protein